jgi:hypothetical protein
MVDLVAQRQPAVACFSATPPVAVMHARYCVRVFVLECQK